MLIGVIPAQAAVKWKFSTSDGKKKADVNKTITLEKQEFCDMNLYRNGKMTTDTAEVPILAESATEAVVSVIMVIQ